VYGANTKWCVTQEKYWNQYLTTHKLIYVLNKKTDTKIAFSRDFSKEKFQAWDQLDREVDPMFINFIPDELFLKIRKELQKDETTGDLTDIKISEIPNDIVSRRALRDSRRDETLRMWGRTTASRNVIDALSNDSRHDIHSDEILTRIRTLMGTQPGQQLQPISPEPPSTQTISDRPNVNYISAYDDYVIQFMGGSETYLNDLP
jgi:hypothetical protein